ncbi:MAG: AbrB/MazE/SpoVT family DNA-binding domain-containing protein [Candidatus Omnitrophota bacterium]
MLEVTLSPKYQVVIPKAIRKTLSLKSGQKIEMLVKEGLITLVPGKPLKEFRGYIKGMNIKSPRDHSQRI